MAEINHKAYNAFTTIRVSTNTSILTTIANYTKHEIEITTHKKHLIREWAQLSIQGCDMLTTYKSNKKLTFINFIK